MIFDLGMMFKKKNIKPEEIKRQWYIVDASDHVLGRLATQIARILLGKHQTYYSPQWDMGDYVIVVNAEKVKVTGKKEKGKTYYRHTGYPGGLKQETLAELRKRRPTEIIRRAVKGMLPKNRLARQIIKKLYVYKGTEHPHEAQKPIMLMSNDKIQITKLNPNA